MKIKKLKFILIGCASAFVLTSGTFAILESVSNNDINIFQNTKDVTITFDENGGVLSGLKEIKTKSNVKFVDISNKPKVIKEGVKNQPGWYKLDGSTKVIITDDTTFNSDTTIYADWKYYNITFNAGEGKFLDGNTTKVFNERTIVHRDEVDAPSCDGKVFQGWTIGNEKTEVNFPYEPSGDTYDLTINANYTELSESTAVNIVLLSDEGEFTNSKKSLIVPVNYGTTYKKAFDGGRFSTPGYKGDKVFSTWKMNNNIINDDYKFTRSTVITPHFTDAISLTFNVASNGGAWNGGSTTSITTPKVKLSSNPTFKTFKELAYSVAPHKDSIELLGWFGDKDATNDAILDETPINETKSFTVYAYYKDPFNISINGTGVTINKKPDLFRRKDKIVCEIAQSTGYALAESQINVQWGGKTRIKDVDYTFTVKDGVGTLTINDAKPYDISVSLTPSLGTYTIDTSGTYTGLSKLTAPASAEYNSSVTVSATASNGYNIKKIFVKDSTGSTTLNTISSTTGSFTFTMPGQNVKIVPSVGKNNYNITTITKGNGVSEASASSTTNIPYLTEITVSASTNTGYDLASMSYNDNSSNANKSVKFTSGKAKFKMPANNVTIIVSSDVPDGYVPFYTDSTSGRTLSTGKYYVKGTRSCTNSNTSGAGLTISGTVEIMIPSGASLTCTGKAASGTSGGGAGIHVASGNTLKVTGSGTLTATGGNAANGSTGTSGSLSIEKNKTNLYYGYNKGGTGGNGGGGAGAGIGTNGGTGGSGSKQSTNEKYTMDGNTSRFANGTAGVAGGTGGSSSKSGSVTVAEGITSSIAGGSRGTSNSEEPTVLDSLHQSGITIFMYSLGSPGTGGNGGYGTAGSATGAGGAGGGGGGSGGNGGYTKDSNGSKWNPKGGRGGEGGKKTADAAGKDGAAGTKSGPKSGAYPSTGGTGGKGGSVGSVGV